MSDALLVALQEMPMSYKSARLIHTSMASCGTRKLAPMPFLFPNINNYKLLVSDKNSRLPKKNRADSICWSQPFLVILMLLNK